MLFILKNTDFLKNAIFMANKISYNMSSTIFSSDSDKERLFLTYRNNPENYQKIKNKLIGDRSKTSYQRTQKSLRFFFAALTFIIIISSAFSIVGDQPNSLIALWIIWTISLVFFILINRYNYRFNFKNQEEQIVFFEAFEKIAQHSESKDQFLKAWNNN